MRDTNAQVLDLSAAREYTFPSLHPQWYTKPRECNRPSARIVPLWDRQARGRSVRGRVRPMRCRGQETTKQPIAVWLSADKAAPGGLDQRAGGHREKVAGGLKALRWLRYCWRFPSSPWGVRGESAPVSPPC